MDVACDQDTVALSAVEFFEPAEMDRLLCGEQKPWYTPQPQPQPQPAFLTSLTLKSWNSSSCKLSGVQNCGLKKLFGLCRTMEELREACHADHGYTLDAPAVQVPPTPCGLWWWGRFGDVAEWSCFGLWCSGCSRRLWG